MAARMDILSFFTKYLDLWESGHDAKLSLTSKAGIFSVQLNLEIDLYRPPDPRRRSTRQSGPRRPGPSRCCRRDRRAEECGRVDAVQAKWPSPPAQPCRTAAAKATPSAASQRGTAAEKTLPTSLPPSTAAASTEPPPSPPCSTAAARASIRPSPLTGTAASQAAPSTAHCISAATADESVPILATKKDKTETQEEDKSVQAFYTSTPQKDDKTYRQNCSECFQNSVCVDCYVSWHKTHYKKRKRDSD